MTVVQETEAEPSWRTTSSEWLPPIIPMVVVLWLSGLLLHLIAPAIGFAMPTLYLVPADVLLVVAAGAAGWQARRAVSGSSKQMLWDAWEEPIGTRKVALVGVVLAVVMFTWSVRGHLSWLGLALAALLTCVVVVAWAAEAASSPPITVIPEGEQPEPLEDFQRVELAWSLAPELPDLQGTVALWIKRSVADEFRAANPVVMKSGSLHQFDWYVDNGQCEEINNLADRLMSLSRQNGLTKYLEVCLVLDLVQRIPYRTDPQSKGLPDYWRFPLETLSDGCGDCEDFAILAVALLSAMGHRTCFFRIPGHVATGVAALPEEAGVSFEATDGERFYFVETTATGWSIGELPDDISRDEVRIAAVVAPLRGRQPDKRLETVDPAVWRIDGSILTRSWIIVGLAGSALAAGLHWLA